MAILLRCLRLGGRKICNTKKLGFVASHRPIPSWSFFTTTTGTTTLPAEEGSLDEHHHLKEAVGDGLENLGVASSEKQRDAEIKPRVELLARFAAFSIRDEQNAKKIEFKRVGSAKVQLVRDGRLYYFTIEALVGGVKKFYEAHVLDTLIERNSISLIEWCEVKSPPKSSTSSSSFDSPQNVDKRPQELAQFPTKRENEELLKPTHTPSPSMDSGKSEWCGSCFRYLCTPEKSVFEVRGENRI